MSIRIEVPSGRGIERRYIADVLISEFLGLDYELIETHDRDVAISFDSERGRIVTPDTLFSIDEPLWLTAASLPSTPLQLWHYEQRGLRSDTRIKSPIPIIYGDARRDLKSDDHTLYLPVDIFGSCFWMLARYEEVANPVTDLYERYPAGASLASREGFLARPIVNEYLELLWQAMSSLWPSLRRSKRQSKTIVSCDVDHPLSPRRTARSVIGALGGDILWRRSLSLALRRGAGYAGARSADPLNTFDWMMEINERAGNKVTFFLIPDRTEPTFDAEYDILDPFILDLMRRIGVRGHEIGMHGSFGSFLSSDQIRKEADRLREAMRLTKIDQSQFGARQHYLRWRTPLTATLLDRHGLAYDSTLGYAQSPGFRCGVCYDFPLFDVVDRKRLTLRERPLVLMEGSVFGKMYLGLDYSDETLGYMTSYLETTRSYSGDFTLLWHNSHLLTEADRRMYVELISA